MAWPVSQDYNEAVQNPRSCFSDPELRLGEPVLNALGLPMPRSGNFADVYEVLTPATKRKWAVKCFTREVPGLRERYREISAYLRQVRLSFTVAFNYLDEGIRIRGQWYPILKMHWVEGLTLNEFVKQSADKPRRLELLIRVWGRLARLLREARIAHCDLQHGNVLLVAGSKAKSLSVKLIDYDGMCVPALVQRKSGEVGHPAFQHPQRLREGTYGLEMDRFPHLVIYCALNALLRGGRGLWDRYDNGDNLLFRQKDLEDPANSRLFKELLGSGDPSVRKLAEILSRAARQPLEQVPLLEEVPITRRPTTTARILNTLPRASRKLGRRTWTLVGGVALLVVGILLVFGHKRPEAPKKEPEVAQTGPVNLFGVFANQGRPRTEATPQTDSVVATKPGPKPEPKTDPVPIIPAKPDPAPQPPTGKLLPVPDKAEQDTAEKGMKELYREDYSKREPAEMIALARKLLQEAANPSYDPTYRFVLLREACDLAAQAADSSLASKAIDQMAQIFAVDGVKMKQEAAAKAARKAQGGNP